MKTKHSLFFLSILLGGSILSACGGRAATTDVYQAGAAATEAPALSEDFAAQAPGEVDAAKTDGSSASAAAPVYDTGTSTDNAAYAASHMIVKNADIKLLVEDTDLAIDRSTQAVGDFSGYIISSRAWYQAWADGKNYKYATITIGVPVEQFEHTLTRLRGLAVQVLDETDSGEDVTNQYVDLQSQLTNLESTRERIKSFLDQATTVDEALRVNQELANIEGQIEQIKGQMNYLHDRSAYSTITINFEPKLPDLATPTPTPNMWNPGETFKDAGKSVTHAYQGIIDFLIWFFVVIVPILAPPLLILWGIWKLLTRKSKKLS